MTSPCKPSEAAARIPTVEGGKFDRYLDQVLVGGRERPTIRIVDYDPAWPERFVAERDRIIAALGDTAQGVEHIGSTSVPGLAAKPTVDIMVAAEDPADEAGVQVPLEATGCVLRVREPTHRMFRTSARDVHVRVLPTGSADIERHLVFRDQLRRCPRDRQAYEALKRELAARVWTDMNHYASAKGELIDEITARARDRHGQT
jgi:GrpB-like predicted nucleotidyltransferase (UPF0157 family)